VRFGLVIALLAAEPTLEWSGSHVCPGAEVELEQALDDYLGESPRASQDVVAALRFEPEIAGGMRLKLAIASRVGEERHELSGPSCVEVIDQAALLIAGVIDPFVFGWPPQPPRSSERPPVQRPRARASEVASTSLESTPVELVEPAAPVDEDEDEVEVEVREFGPIVEAPEDDDREQPAVTGALGVAATAFAGLFPNVGGGAEVEGAVERGAFRWQLAGSGWFGGRFRSSEADVGGDLWALALGSGLCGVPATRRLRVPLCAVGGVGFVSAEAVGTLEPRRTYRPWAWAGAEARVMLLARPNLGISLGVGVHAALVRPAWAVRSPDFEWRIPPVSGVLRLTVELRGIGSRGKSSSPAINPLARGQ
jgi:hypothetical protein